MRGRAIVGGCLGLLAWAASAQAPAPTAGTPNLSGSWRLNLKRSDDLSAQVEKAAGPDTLAGGGRRERVLPKGNEVSEVVRLEMRAWLVAIAERAQTEAFLIEQSERDVKTGFGDDLRIFYFGREGTSSDARGVRRKTKMRWQAGQLLIEETGDDKMKLTHLYTLLPDGQNLLVVYHIEGGQLKQPLDLKLMFDREPAR